MATARRMPQNVDALDTLTDKLIQNGNTTEIGGNVEVDGDLKVNGQIIGGGGTGNIDLYKHNITFISTEIFPAQGTGGVDVPAMEFYFTVYSSKNIAVDSLTDLKTLLGNTFKESVSGAYRTSATGRFSAFYITETAVHDIIGHDRPYPAGTWTDTVTTI